MITTNTTGFRSICKALAKKAEIPFPQAVKQQTALTLKAAIQRVKTVSPSAANKDVARKIEAKFHTFAGGKAGTKNTVVAGEKFEGAKGTFPQISISARKGRTWYGGPKGKWRLVDTHKMSPQQWAEYQQAEAQRKSAEAQAHAAVKAGVKRSRGLAKRAFYDAAVDLGIEGMMGNGVPAYAKKAIPANRKLYKNATGRDESGLFKTLLVTTVTQPILAHNDMGVNALQGAINSRKKAFETDLSKGVFEDVKQLAARYPGVTVTR